VSQLFSVIWPANVHKVIYVTLGSPKILYIYKISHNYGGWEVSRPAVGKPKPRVLSFSPHLSPTAEGKGPSSKAWREKFPNPACLNSGLWGTGWVRPIYIGRAICFIYPSTQILILAPKHHQTHPECLTQSLGTNGPVKLTQKMVTSWLSSPCCHADSCTAIFTIKGCSNRNPVNSTFSGKTSGTDQYR
jgi:hypothetical protein